MLPMSAASHGLSHGLADCNCGGWLGVSALPVTTAGSWIDPLESKRVSS